MAIRDEYELIAHPRIADCSMFLVDLIYRPLHLHKEIELCYVISGAGTVTNEQGSVSAAAGDILLFDSGIAHEIHAEGDALRLLAIQTSKAFCLRYYPQLRNLSFGSCRVNDFCGAGQIGELKKTMLTAFSAYLSLDASGIFLCMAKVNEIFSMLLAHVPYRMLDDTQASTQAKNAERLHRVLAYLEEHFREPVRLRELARMEGITETHLSHFLKEQLHIPFQEYLSRLRLEAAMYLLKTSSMSVTDVSYACGFSDPKYLNLCFQKNIGISPMQWRKLDRQQVDWHFKTNQFTMQHILPEADCAAILQRLGV